MATRAQGIITVTRPGGGAVALAGLRSLSLSIAGETISGGAVVVSGAAFAQAAAGLASWSVSAECVPPSAVGLPDAGFTAVRLGQRAAEEVEITFALGDGDTYTGPAIITGFGRPRDPQSAGGYAVEFTGAGPLAEPEAPPAGPPIAYTGSKGQDGPNYSQVCALPHGAGSLSLAYTFGAVFENFVRFEILHDDVVVADTGELTGGGPQTGSLSWDYDGSPPAEVVVRQTEGSGGNVWSYTLTYTPD